MLLRKKYIPLIGENGIGKTKLLESLFQVLLGSHDILTSIKSSTYHSEVFVLSSARIDKNDYPFSTSGAFINSFFAVATYDEIKQHNLPIVYMASQNRGFIQHKQQAIQAIGSFKQRQREIYPIPI